MFLKISWKNYKWCLNRKKSKCWSNPNCHQKSKFLVKIKIFGKNQNFRQKSKFPAKIKISGKNQNFRQQSKFPPKIKISAKNQNFCQNYRIVKTAENRKNNTKNKYFTYNFRNGFLSNFFCWSNIKKKTWKTIL